VEQAGELCTHSQILSSGFSVFSDLGSAQIVTPMPRAATSKGLASRWGHRGRVAPARALSLADGTRHASRRHPLTQRRCGVKTTRNIAAAGVSYPLATTTVASPWW